MPWIWNSPDEDKVPVYAEYDDLHSSLDGSRVLDDKPLPADAGVAIFRVRRFKSRRVRELACLPTTASAPVINKELASVLFRCAEPAEAQLYPVRVHTPDAVINDYSFVIPLNRLVCTDVEKSQITFWIIPSKSAHGYKSLQFFPGCLGNLAIARDDVTGLVVVSDQLRNALLGTGDNGLAFTAPERTSSYF